MMTTQEKRCNWRTVHAYARAGHGSLSVYFPTREDVESLQVGDYAPSAIGTERKVTRIFGRGVDRNGRAFVCYYTELIDGVCGTTLSNSATEDTVERSVRTGNVFHSVELDAIERNSRNLYATNNR